MSRHRAFIDWQRGAADRHASRYGRAHVWRFDGGAQVRASSSPHVVPEPMSDAAAVDPEEAVVAAIASCRMLRFLDIAARRGHRAESCDGDAVGEMAKNAEGKLAITDVTLRPRVVFAGAMSRDALAAVQHAAHEACFLAASVRTRITFEPVHD